MHWILWLLIIVLVWISDAVAQSTRLSNPNLGSDNSISSSSKTPVLPCTANASAPSWDEGRQVPCSTDLLGNTRVTETTARAGENVPLDLQKVEQQFSYANIVLAAPTTTVIKSAPGMLHSIVINKTTANGVITCYDNTAASGDKIATITQPATLLASQVPLPYDVLFGTGLTCVTSGAAQDITVNYR